MAQHVCIKQEPLTYEDDQEDILMSYLNSDYMSTVSSPTSSSCSWNTTMNHGNQIDSPIPTLSQSPICASEIHQGHYGISPPSPADHWGQHPNSPINEQYNHQALINRFPFIMTSHIPFNNTSYHGQMQYIDHIQHPASPPNSSYSSTCSSDTEQPKNRRGRKKRSSRDRTMTTSPSTPTAIAPAATTVKQLATILPSAQQDQREEIGSANSASVNKYAPVKSTLSQKDNGQLDCTALDTQKAAAIAKRQERLIKNRAAALLSRKRKREHLTALEEQRTDLTRENEVLKVKLMQLEKENLQLKGRLEMILVSILYLISSKSRSTSLASSNSNNSGMSGASVERLKVLQLQSNVNYNNQSEKDDASIFNEKTFMEVPNNLIQKRSLLSNRKRFERVTL